MKRIGGLFGILILAGLGQAASPSPAAPVGLQAEYTFAEGSGATAGDSSGSGFHAALQNGAAFSAGRVGFGVSLDGVNDFVNLGDNRSLVQNASAATISLWVKPGSVIPSGSFRELVSLSIGATNPTKTSRLAVSLKGDGTSGGQVFLGGRSTDTESQKNVTTSGGVTVGTWTHLAGVVDFQNSTLKVYINGLIAATATGVGFASPTTANAPCRNSALGAQDDGVGNHYQGGMDQARIYNRSLSDAEVQALASGDTLQAHWKLDDGSGLVASDASGNLHTGTLKNGLETGWIAGGQVAGALQFDGVDDYVQVDAPGILQNVNSATIATWIKPSSTIPAGSFRELISISVGGAPSDVSRFALALRGDGTAGDVFLGGRASDSETQKSITHDSSLPVGEWVHVAGVANFSQGTLEIYINGLLATSGPVAFVQPATSNSASPSIALGAQDSGGSNRYAGAMDEVRVYGRALTACEVQELAGRDGLQAHWKFDESSGITAADSSATGLTATLKNGASFVSGKLGNALSLDGVDDYADLGLSLPILKGANAGTVAAWINLSSVPAAGAFREIVSVAVGGSPSNTSRLALAIKGTGAGTADLFVGGRSTDAEAQQTLSAVAGIQPGTWRHVAATLDVGHNQIRVYLDGALIASANAAFSQPTMPTTAPANGALGAQDLGNSNWNHAKLDEVRIYCRVLSASEIGSLAASAAPAAPVLSLVEEGNQQVKLSWTTVPGTDFYNLKRSTTQGTGYVTIASTGTTSFTDTGLTNDVTYYYVVTAQNSAGESGISNEIPGRPRVAVPPPPVILLPPSGAYLATSTPTVSGTSSSPGLTIRLQVDGQENGVTTSVVVGNWSLVVPNALGEGPHTLRATASNGSGTSGLSNSVQIVIDTIAPVVSNPIPQDQSTVFSTTPSISASWSDANINTSTAEIRLDGNLVTPQTITGSGFTFTPSTPLSLTSHSVTAKVKDLAGNESNVLPWSFTVAAAPTDTIPPVISNLSPGDGTFVSLKRPPLSATITDAGGAGINVSSVALILNGVLVSSTVSLQGSDSATVSFTPGFDLQGQNTFRVDAADNASNAAVPQTSTFTVDAVPPTISITSPVDGGVSTEYLVLLDAAVQDDLSGVDANSIAVFLNQQDVTSTMTVSSGSTLSRVQGSLVASSGTNRVDVRATDRAGGVATQTINFQMTIPSTGPGTAFAVSPVDIIVQDVIMRSHFPLPSHRPVIYKLQCTVGGSPASGVEVSAVITQGQGSGYVYAPPEFPSVTDESGYAHVGFMALETPGMVTLKFVPVNAPTGDAPEETFQVIRGTIHVDLFASIPGAQGFAFVTLPEVAGGSAIQVEEVDSTGAPLTDPSLSKIDLPETLFFTNDDNPALGSAVVPYIAKAAAGQFYLKATAIEFGDADGNAVSDFNSGLIQAKPDRIDNTDPDTLKQLQIPGEALPKEFQLQPKPAGATTKVGIRFELIDPGDKTGTLALGTPVLGTPTVHSKDPAGKWIVILGDNIPLKFTAGAAPIETAIISMSIVDDKGVVGGLQIVAPNIDRINVALPPIRLTTTRTAKGVSAVPVGPYQEVLDNNVPEERKILLKTELPDTNAPDKLEVTFRSLRTKKGDLVELDTFSPGSTVILDMVKDGAAANKRQTYVAEKAIVIAAGKVPAANAPARGYAVLRQGAFLSVSIKLPSLRRYGKRIPTALNVVTDVAGPDVPALVEVVNGKINANDPGTNFQFVIDPQLGSNLKGKISVTHEDLVGPAPGKFFMGTLAPAATLNDKDVKEARKGLKYLFDNPIPEDIREATLVITVTDGDGQISKAKIPVRLCSKKATIKVAYRYGLKPAETKTAVELQGIARDMLRMHNRVAAIWSQAGIELVDAEPKATRTTLNVTDAGMLYVENADPTKDTARADFIKLAKDNLEAAAVQAKVTVLIVESIDVARLGGALDGLAPFVGTPEKGRTALIVRESIRNDETRITPAHELGHTFGLEHTNAFAGYATAAERLRYQLQVMLKTRGLGCRIENAPVDQLQQPPAQVNQFTTSRTEAARQAALQ